MNRLLLGVDRVVAHGRTLLGIAMAAFLVAGVALAVRDGDRVKSLDEPAFLDIGSNLAFHGQFAHTNVPGVDGYDPKLPLGSLRPTAYRAPGYAFFIAPFQRLGAGFVVLRIVNAILVALTLLVLYRFLAARYSPVAGTIAVLLTLGYPVLVYAASTLYPQTLSAFLLVASMVLLERLQPGARMRAFLGAAITYGLLVLTVPVYLLLIPVVFIWLLWSRRASLAQAVLVVAVVVGCVGLWTARNLAVFHAPVAMGTSSGFMLLSGNCPNTRYDQASVDVNWPDEVYAEITGKNEVERDQIMVRAALRFVRENPGDAFVLYVQKFLYWFSYRNEVVSDRVVPGGAGAGPVAIRDLVMLLTYGSLLLLLIVRLALVRRYPMTSWEVLLLALYVGGGGAYAVYLTRIRYRLPFDWLLITMNAVFLAQVVQAHLGSREGGRPTPPARVT
jgi:hypothetical protein